jgi:hypothetical protein
MDNDLKAVLQQLSSTLDALVALVARVEVIEARAVVVEHNQATIAQALGVLDGALGGALELLKSHHNILERSIKRPSGNTPRERVLN